MVGYDLISYVLFFNTICSVYMTFFHNTSVLLFVSRITSKSMTKVCAQRRMSLSPRLLATDRSKAVILV